MFSKSTRGTLLVVVLGPLALMVPQGASAQAKFQSAQDAPPVSVQGAPQANSVGPAAQAANAQTDDSAQSSQEMSLGDLARIARAQKNAAAKAVRVIDDENMPRGGGGINVVGGSGDGSGGSFSGAGKMTLLDFWASWCGPCRESVPDLKALQRTYSSDQLEVISVNEDKNENAGRSFASDNGMNWEVQFDPQGSTAREHGVNAFPTFILLDGEGHEVQRFVGEDSSDPLANRIGPYLKKIKGTT